jgi:hypothetical protein
VCVQVPCVYLLSAASTVIRNKHDLHKNDENGGLLHEQPTVHNQTLINEIPCQSIFLKRNQEVANGHLIFAAQHCRCENQRRQWPKKVKLAGRGAEVVPAQLRGTLRSEKPPVPRQPTPEFLGCPSGDLLKGTEIWRNWEENGGKSLPCRETLQLFDILRGGTSFNCSGMLGCGGRICH